MPDCLPVRDLLTHIIGGGWGSDSADDVNEQPVAIIRGADFPQVQVGDVTSLPVRFESRKRLETRRLQDGDIVLEISGGTNERPTGRSVFVSKSLLAQVPVPVIPASFCRLLRPNPLMVEPRYLYFWLQDMFEQGRTWAYQVRSTGIANFQTEYFLDHELVTLPPLDEQRRIAGVLGALDDLIEVNRGLIRDLAEMGDCVFENWAAGVSSQVSLGETMQRVAEGVDSDDLTSEAIYLGLEHFGTDAEGLIGRGTTEGLASNKVRFNAGDVLYGKLRPYFRKVARPGFPGVCTTEAWVLRAKEPATQEFVHWMARREAFTTMAMAGSEGTKMPRANWSHLSGMQVPNPAEPGLPAASNTVQAFWQAANSLEQEIAQLDAARVELLPLLMSGRVRVRGDGVAA